MLNLIKQLLAKSEVASSIFYTLSNKLFVVVINLGSFLVIVRFLTEEQMGVWAIFLSITTMVEVARGALVKNALIRLLNTENESNAARIQTAAFVLNIITVIVIAIISLALIELNNNIWNLLSMSNMLFIYIFTSFILTIFFHVEFVLQSKADFRSVFKIYTLRQTIFFISIICLFLFYSNSDPLVAMVLLQLISVFAAMVYALYIAKKLLLYDKLEFLWVRKLWKYGRYVLATNLNSLIFRNTDHFMIVALISPTAVAYYNVAVRITNFLDLPSTAVSEALFPKSVLLAKSNTTSDNKRLYETTVGAIIATLLPVTVCIFLFSEQTISIIAGEKYIEAKAVLQITLVYSLMLPFLKQFGMIIDSMGKPQLNTKVTIVLSLSNALLNYILIRSIGLQGAALATLCTYTLGAILSLLVLNKYLQVSFISIVKQLFLTYTTLWRYSRTTTK